MLRPYPAHDRGMHLPHQVEIRVLCGPATLLADSPLPLLFHLKLIETAGGGK